MEQIRNEARETKDNLKKQILVSTEETDRYICKEVAKTCLLTDLEEYCKANPQDCMNISRIAEFLKEQVWGMVCYSDISKRTNGENKTIKTYKEIRKGKKRNEGNDGNATNEGNTVKDDSR